MGVGSNSEPAYVVTLLCIETKFAGAWSRPGPVILSEAQAEPKDLPALGTYVEKKIL